jgi:group II intron reverse transcriptase/maturase
MRWREKSAEVVVAASKPVKEPEDFGEREGLNGRESETPASLGRARRQKSTQVELPLGCRVEDPRAQRSGEARAATSENERSGTDRLMEEVVERVNAMGALKRVKQNKGSPGIDGMTVAELPAYLVTGWTEIREHLLAGTYQPSPVRQHEIPKSDGGARKLGIPTVVDRFVQQAILQVLQPRFDPTFSRHSYGFRPGRSAHQAVCAAQRYLQEGRRWVVDVDLEAFFDRVNHDILMARLAARIADKRMLRIIRRYLEAGIMADGVAMERHQGTPQGGPLSPLLGNVLLDEVDQELEKRGHAFARYADDCNVYVRSQRAGERVMETLRRLYTGLHLRINETKSAVARPWNRKFLGYSFWVAQGQRVKRRVAAKTMKTMKERIRQITARNGGRSIATVVEELRGYLVGWKNYFKLADTPGVFRDLDEWIRHRLRAVHLKQWKRGRTAYRRLLELGLNPRGAAQVAANTRRWWRNSGMLLHVALPTSYFDALGVPRLAP